jgi:signal transduction histidine kinase
MINGAVLRLLSKDRHRDWTTEAIDQRLGSEAGFQAALARVAKSGKPVEKPEVHFESKILSLFTAPILNDHPGGKSERLGAVVLVEDITEAKLLEQARDDFFSIASHELRTPLTAVRGNAALLQQEYSSKVHEAPFDEMVSDIHDASVRLIEIVNDFLDATRLEQGRIKFENDTFGVHEVVKAVTYEMATVAKMKDTQLKMGEGLEKLPLIYADKNRVKQVVYNLLGNALKFTEKGTITVDAVVDGAKLKVLVRDTGTGIPEESQQLLFRKFQQASNVFTTRESRGTGLGLYISKLITEQMGGRIALESSKVGVGTTFSFTVPLAKEEQKPATKGLV